MVQIYLCSEIYVKSLYYIRGGEEAEMTRGAISTLVLWVHTLAVGPVVIRGGIHIWMNSYFQGGLSTLLYNP